MSLKDGVYISVPLTHFLSTSGSLHFSGAPDVLTGNNCKSVQKVRKVKGWENTWTPSLLILSCHGLTELLLKYVEEICHYFCDIHGTNKVTII